MRAAMKPSWMSGLCAVLALAACGDEDTDDDDDDDDIGTIDLELTVALDGWYTSSPPTISGPKVTTPGLIIGLNGDDTDNDTRADNSDTDVDGASDARQLLVLRIKEVADGAAGDQLELFQKSGSGEVRVFRRTDSASELFVSGGTMAEADATQLFTDADNGDVELYVEGVSTGPVELCVRYDGSISGEACVQLVVVRTLRVAISGNTNRDAVLDDVDLVNRRTWSDTSGAIIFVNGDADCALPGDAADNSDSTLGCPPDVTDIADVGELRLDLRSLDLAGSTGWELQLTYQSPDSKKVVNVFAGLTNGAAKLPAALTVGGGVVVHAIDIAALGSSDHTLGIEGLEYDRDVDLVLCVRGGAAKDVDAVCDKVAIRTNPVTFQSNLEQVERAAYTPISFLGIHNTPLKTKLVDFVGATNVVSSTTTWDVWTQDEIEIVGSKAPRGSAQCVVHLPRDLPPPDGLEIWAPTEIGPDVAYVSVRPGLSVDSENYGGNLEVLPSTTGALGRLVVGKNMEDALVTRLGNLSRGHGTPIEIDTDWLSVGHVDEVAAIVPNGTGWAVAVADTKLAEKIFDGTAGVTKPVDRAAMFWHCNGDPRTRSSACIKAGTVSGAVAKTGAAAARMSASGLGFTSRYHWLRIYTGAGKGQVAHISSVINSTTVEVDMVFDLPEAHHARCAALALGGIMMCDDMPPIPFGSDDWFRLPTAGDKVVVVDETLDMRANNPYALTFEGALKIPGLYTAKEMRDKVLNADFYNQQKWAQERIEDTIQAFTDAGVPAASIIRVPVFYVANGSSKASLDDGEAWTPNAANVQIFKLASGTPRVLVPMQFGPTVGGTDPFHTVISNKLPGTKVFVDDFDVYHVNFGEVHCGTNLYRANELTWWGP